MKNRDIKRLFLKTLTKNVTGVRLDFTRLEMQLLWDVVGGTSLNYFTNVNQLNIDSAQRNPLLYIVDRNLLGENFHSNNNWRSAICWQAQRT